MWKVNSYPIINATRKCGPPRETPSFGAPPMEPAWSNQTLQEYFLKIHIYACILKIDLSPSNQDYQVRFLLYIRDLLVSYSSILFFFWPFSISLISSLWDTFWFILLFLFFFPSPYKNDGLQVSSTSCE